MIYCIAYDVGTTGLKTCLFSIDKEVKLIAKSYCDYNLYLLPNGGAEQDADEWWNAMCQSTHQVFEKTDVTPDQISGISFCSQMQGFVAVDKDCNALRRPMSYMDQRARKEFRDTQTHGITISDVALPIMLKSLVITHAASTSVKDPLWKYKWMEANEPELFKKMYKWLDVKEYLIARCTGRCIMTPDSAYSTFLYDSRKGREGWSKSLCKTYGVNPDHLPEIIECHEVAGKLTETAARELGLTTATSVYGGGGDATLIGIGAGCTNTGQTHIYTGTSGWVSTIIDKQVVDVIAMIAGIIGAIKGKYNYFAEMETAGKSVEWVRDNLVEDRINAYLEKKPVTEGDTKYDSLYDYMTDVVRDVPAGSGGVIFTPWLHGNRCPFEDPNAFGMFFNLKIETSKPMMIRSVFEGICFHLRWMLECQDKKIKTSDTIRFAGGVSLSPVMGQILADITKRNIETVPDAKDVGSIGAAMLIAVGEGVYDDISKAGQLIKPLGRYTPSDENRAVYERNYKVFRRLYESNKTNYKILNETT